MKNKAVKKILKQSDLKGEEQHLQFLIEFKELRDEELGVLKHAIENDKFGYEELNIVTLDIAYLQSITERLQLTNKKIIPQSCYTHWRNAHNELQRLLTAIETKYKYVARFQCVFSLLDRLNAYCLSCMAAYEPECRAILKKSTLHTLETVFKIE